MVCRELPEAEAVPTTFRPAQLPKLKKVLKGIKGPLNIIYFSVFTLHSSNGIYSNEAERGLSLNYSINI
jgi:hypothetical protein